MEKRNQTVIKLAQTALMAALCYVSFTFLQIKIPLPGGDATSIHIGNAFCVLGALILGGWYGGLAGAIGMSIADLMDPVYNHRGAKDICAETVYRTDRRPRGAQNRKDR